MTLRRGRNAKREPEEEQVEAKRVTRSARSGGSRHADVAQQHDPTDDPAMSDLQDDQAQHRQPEAAPKSASRRTTPAPDTPAAAEPGQSRRTTRAAGGGSSANVRDS